MPAKGQVRVQPWELDALRRYAAGETAASIAASLGKPVTTVEGGFRRWAKAGALTGSQRYSTGVQVNWDLVEQIRTTGRVPRSSSDRTTADLQPSSDRTTNDLQPSSDRITNDLQLSSDGNTSDLLWSSEGLTDSKTVTFTHAEVIALKAIAARELSAEFLPAEAEADTQVMFNARVPSRLLAAMRAKCERLNTTPSQVVRELLARWVAGQM